MGRLTTEERIKIVKTYYKNGDSNVGFQSNKIFFADEVPFSLRGYVSKQNYRIWCSEKPEVIAEKPSHPEKVVVWCALWFRGVIGSYLSENNVGETSKGSSAAGKPEAFI